MSLSKSAVQKPTTVVILFIVLVALGLYATSKLPLDLYPDIEIPYIIVSTTYANAGPEEVERSVSRTLESTLSGITGLKKLMSVSSSGSSMIMLELNYGTDLDSASNEVRDRLDLVKAYLPSDADVPVIIKMDPSMLPIMQLSVTGNRTPEELREYAEEIIQPRLEQIDGVASANIMGGRERAIKVEIPRDRLEAYSLTITQIAQMIGAQNMQASGGTISEGDLNYTITTVGEYKTLDDIRNTVISYKVAASNGMSAPEVKTILLRDIADVYDGYKKQSTLAYVDGVPGVILNIQKQSGKNSVQSAEKIRQALASIQKDLPGDVKIEETMNTTDIIETSIGQVASSALSGAALAVLILLVFLRSIKSTIIIGLTIPISLVITLGIMYFTGFSLNIMTLAGLALGVGMLVDNSIVILENIFSYRERGAKATVAAVLGSQEMLMAITSSTLTTICVFLPLVMFGSQLGMVGQIFSGLTFTVVFSLLCSLVVAIILVPVLASKYFKLENISEKTYKGLIGKIDKGLGIFFEKLDNAYAGAVRKVLHHRKLTIFVILALFVGSCMLIPKVGFVFMPASAANDVTINVEMPKGTRLESTEAVVRQLEAFAKKDLKGIKRTTVSVGGSGLFGGGASTSSARLQISLYPYAQRLPGYDSDVSVKDKMRKYFSAFPGASISFSENSMAVSGGGIDVIVKSDDLDLARNTANAIEKLMETKMAHLVSEPSTDLEDGLPQVEIKVDREKMYNLGLNVYGVGNEIKANINGVTASRFRDKGDEIDIVIELDERDRQKLTDLDQIFVNNSNGMRIPVSSFAEYVESTSPVQIRRENQTRVIHVTATPKVGLSITEVQKELEKTIKENIPHDDKVIIEYGGDFQQLAENLSVFAVIIIMAMVLVFAVMASQFESFKDPFIVIFTIPLALIGIVAIYLMTGMPLNLITAVGLLVLVGIIVNNGIVLVDYTNLERKRGLELEEAW